MTVRLGSGAKHGQLGERCLGVKSQQHGSFQLPPCKGAVSS